MNLARIKKEGKAGKRYIFFRDGKKEKLVNNKYSDSWWDKATESDIRRVAVS